MYVHNKPKLVKENIIRKLNANSITMIEIKDYSLHYDYIIY